MTETPNAPASTASQRLSDVRAHPGAARRLEKTLLELHGMGINGFLVLRALQAAVNGKLTRKELAERLEVSPSTIALVVHELEKAAYIERETDRHDARIASPILTSAGRVATAQASRTLADCGWEP
jgi:DNA-binding MarR family transcriptional regulator